MGAELLITGSIVAAFFAGAVKNRRWRLLPLTFLFAAGLALVLVPITLGVSLLAGAIARYHAPLYWAGGLTMIALAGLAVSGTMWALPASCAPRTPAGETRLLRAEPVRLRLAGRVVATNTLNVAVAIGFVIMGVAIVLLANDTDMTEGTAAQDVAASTLTDVHLTVQGWLSPVPEPVVGLGRLAVAGLFAWAILSERRRRASSQQADDALDPAADLSEAPIGGPSSLAEATPPVTTPACHHTTTSDQGSGR